MNSLIVQYNNYIIYRDLWFSDHFTIPASYVSEVLIIVPRVIEDMSAWGNGTATGVFGGGKENYIIVLLC